MPSKLLTMLGVVGMAAALGGCSGDDAPSTSAGPAIAGPAVSGQVVGSFIENALVCMDSNKNGICDAGESSTRTVRDGSFTIALDAKADLIAEIGTDAFTAAKADFSDRRAVRARYVLRTGNSLWVGGNTVVSALSTIVSADMDTGTSIDAARKKLADALAVDVAKVLSNYNLEADAMVKGTLEGYSKNTTVVLQDLASAVAAGRTASKDLAAEIRAALFPAKASGSGTVKYVWTQVGADDTPFSKLEITGINTAAGITPTAPSLSTNPAGSGVSIGSATFATRLASGSPALYSDGGMVARAIVIPDASGAAACPMIRINGVASAMTVRAPATTGVASRGDFYGSARSVDFAVLTCEARLPATVTSASIDGRPLKVMSSTDKVNRIIVMGDTGCRLKGPTAFVQAADGTVTGGDRLQDCSSEASWPYNKLSRVAASFNPDLILHNGDMHYREGFPEGVEKSFGGAANAANGGSEQDNSTIKAKFAAAGILDSITYGWRAWEEDFFKPAGPLLAAAPWALTRGNHELCDRAAQGWFRFLDPRNFPKAGVAYAKTDEPEYDGTDGAAANFKYVRGSSFSVAKNCSQYTDPVATVIGDLQLVLIDVGMMNDVPGLSSSMGSTNGDHVRVARQINAISNLPASSDASKVTWFVGHKPLFAYAGSAAVAGNTPQPAAARTWQYQKAIAPGVESVSFGNGVLPSNTQMTHAGHIHGFQMISQPAEANMPISVLMGTTGDNLEGLIEANSGVPYAPTVFGNNITGGRFPWFDQVINSVTVKAASWYTSVARNPQNFSSSAIAGAGKKETAVLTEFSFLVIDRISSNAGGPPNWLLQVYDSNRKLLRSCTTSGKTASCDG
jgi:hypothetical protein